MIAHRASRGALSVAALWLVVVFAGGCGPTVGDACENSTACGTGLICDQSTPDGYCTRSPCRAGECPEEGVCVDFGAEASWCMRRCEAGQGCRDGLACVAPDAFDTATECLGATGGSGCKFCAVKP
mgnify:CR=1 FL=1